MEFLILSGVCVLILITIGFAYRFYPQVPAIQKPFSISIEGNIGSGKSTIVLHLAKHVPYITTFLEPVHKWQNFSGLNLLDLFYKAPKEYFIVLQNYIAFTFVEIHRQLVRTKIKVTERSIFSSLPFIQAAQRLGIATNIECCQLIDFLDVLKSSIQEDLPNYIIYLRVSPSVSLSRLLARAQTEEVAVTLDYLQTVHDFHEEWMATSSLAVFVIDADLPIDTARQPVLQKINEIYHSV